jgi:hypothetical protein
MKTSELSDKTLAAYESTINAIYKSLKLEGARPDKGDWIEKHWKQIVEHVEASASLHTRKNRYAVLKVYCTLYDLPDKICEFLDDKMGELAGKVTDEYSKNKMNEKQEANWVGVQEMRAMLQTLRAKLSQAIDTYAEYKALCKYLMLCIHIEVPLRNDLADAKIMSTLPKDVDEKTNYIIVRSKKSAQIILNVYKTRKEYGSKTIELPAHVSAELHQFFPVIQEMSPHSWFICDRDDAKKPISRTTYTKWFQSIFKGTGKSVSTTQVRRAVVSDLYDVDENEMAKKQQLAGVMGHSVQQAGLSYAKHVKDDQK